MKLLYTVAALLFLTQSARAQVGIGTIIPNPHAVLELKLPGSNQGFLLPRLTTAQRIAITLNAQDNGLLVFDSDEQKFYYWQNSQWLPIKSGNETNLLAGTGIEITGNTISAVPDGDGDAANEIQDLKLTGTSLAITNNTSATAIDLSPLIDADGDATNEIQELQLIGNTLSITNNAAATSINLAPFAGTNTDNQTLSFNTTTGALDITGGNTVTLNATGAAGGILSGTYPTPGLIDNAISSTKIIDGAVATIDLANLAVTTAKLSDLSVTTVKITDAAVTDVKIIDGAVTSAKLANLAVTGGKIADNAITSTKILDGAVTSADILDGAVATTDLANVAVTTAKIADAAISTAKLGDLSVTTPKLGDASVSTAKIADAAITGVKLENIIATPGVFGTATAVPQFTLDAHGRISSVTAVNIAGVAPAGAASGDLAGTYPNPSIAAAAGSNIVTAINNASTAGTIAASHLDGTIVLNNMSPAASAISGTFASGLAINDNAVTSAKILDGAVGTIDLANLGVTTAKLGDGSVSTAKIADAAITGPKLENTAVTPGLYGAASSVPQFNVDAHGRITSVAAVPISGVAPAGAAGGILSGTYPSPGLNNTMGNTIVSTLNDVATTTTIAVNRLAGAVVLDSESPTASDIAGTFNSGLTINANAVTTAKINDGAVTTAKILDGAVTNAKISGVDPAKIIPSGVPGQVLTTVAGATMWSTLPALAGGTVTSITAGTGLSGGTITTSGTIAIANGGVTGAEIANGTITNTDVSATAAIAVSKLAAGLTDGQVLTSLSGTPQWTTPSTTASPLADVLAKGNDAKDQDALNFNSITITNNNGSKVVGSGALNVNGAHFVSFTMFNDGYTVQPQDYILISIGATAKPMTIALPKAQENKGRILIIRSQGRTVGEAVTVAATDLLDGVATSEPLYLDGNISDNVAYSLTIISNGVTWLTIDRGIADNRSKG